MMHICLICIVWTVSLLAFKPAFIYTTSLMLIHGKQCRCNCTRYTVPLKCFRYDEGQVLRQVLMKFHAYFCSYLAVHISLHPTCSSALHGPCNIPGGLQQ